MEQWKAVQGYEGLYEVSSHGRVRSLDRPWRPGIRSFKGKELKPQKKKRGYYAVALNKNGISLIAKIHSLVAESFIGPRPDGEEVRHRDSNPLNNRLENLVYGTRSDNVRDAVKHGTHFQKSKTHCPKDHEYNEANIRWYDGRRYCKGCERERIRK